mgnify:FL=1
MKLITGFFLGSLFAASLAWATILPDPVGIKDKQTLLYLRKIRDVHNNVVITTTSPNGNRRGRSGDIVIFNDSETYRWRVNTDTDPSGGTTWASVTS